MKAATPAARIAAMGPALETTLIVLNASLYAAVGYLTFLGIFAPVVGTVRFWPVVVIPALFAVLFSPRIGALGAGIGIFISDMFIHGNPVLSLTVGVTSNLAGFYVLGLIYHRFSHIKNKALIAGVLQTMPLAVMAVAAPLGWLGDEGTATIFVAAGLVSLALGLFFSLSRSKYALLVAASSLGLIVGSLIIGFGLWAFSQFSPLPFGIAQAPLYAAASWFLWTYLTEIPFLVIILPPLVTAVSRSLPARFGGVQVQ